MKKKPEIENIGDLQDQPLKSDFAALRTLQAEHFAREKAEGQGATDAWDDAEFLSLDELKAQLKPVRKKPVSIRFDADVLEWVQSAGKGYQTMLNELLRKLKDGKLELVEAKRKAAATPSSWPPRLKKKEKRIA